MVFHYCISLIPFWHQAVWFQILPSLWVGNSFVPLPKLCKTAVKHFCCMYHSEDVPHSSEVALASDTSGEQPSPNRLDATPMPKVLQVEMAPAKLPFPNKMAARKLIESHFKAAGGDMVGLGHIRKVCLTNTKRGVYIWIDCDRDCFQTFWVKSTRKLAGAEGQCEEMPKDWVMSQLEKDKDLKEKSERFAIKYAESSMSAVASLAAMLSERAPTENRKRKENKLHAVMAESNVVSKKYVRAHTGEKVDEALARQDLEDEDQSE